MRVWIDLSNSPHPLLFEPIVRTLRSRGHEVLLTARDNAQTVELARQRWPEAVVVGGESPSGKTAKGKAMAGRVLRLRRWASQQGPVVALSHNSYAQILAAASLRLPAVTAMDYEHQPVNHLAFRLASAVLVPEILPIRTLRLQGAVGSKLIRYPGLKEELYIGDFHPDPQILKAVGLAARPRTLVVARPPPNRAIYHSFGNPMFDQALRAVCADPDTTCVTLVRHAEQIAALNSLGLQNCIVCTTAVDSRSLMYAADLMIGAGGTMTREAALMGIPTWTLFAGPVPAADLWLERQGRLNRLIAADQLRGAGPRPNEPRSPEGLKRRAEAIGKLVVETTLAVGERSNKRGEAAA